jgi:uncharacterized protein (DUF433 family)
MTACFVPGVLWWFIAVPTVRNQLRSLMGRLADSPRPQQAPKDLLTQGKDGAAALQGQVMPTMAVRITKTPDVNRGQACIRGSSSTVWKIIQWRRRGKSDAWLLARSPWLVPDDLTAAWRYAAAFPDEIEAAIRNDDQREEKSTGMLVVGGVFLALFGFSFGVAVAGLFFRLEVSLACGIFGVIAVFVPVVLIFRKVPKWQRKNLWLGGFLGFMTPVLGGLAFATIVSKLFGDVGAVSQPGFGGLAAAPGVVVGLWLMARFIRRWEAEPSTAVADTSITSSPPR